MRFAPVIQGICNCTGLPGSAAVPGAKPSTAGITFGEDCDIDSEGRTYVADRGSSMIDIIGPDGTFANSFDAPSPVSIAWLGDGDPTTRRMLEEILAVEEEHANDMVNLLDDKK